MRLKHFCNHRLFEAKTPSTNSLIYLKNNESKLINGTLLLTNNQTDGKGQRGQVWVSEANKNLTFSVITFPKIDSKNAFYLNIISALAVQKTLNDLNIESKIKWPNDILVKNNKICGILVENQISSKLITQSIIGIGLNVKQTKFDENIKATSIELQGLIIELEDVLDQIYYYLDFYYNLLTESNYKLLLKLYYNKLFWYNCIGTFEEGGLAFKALVKGVNEHGLLHLLKMDNSNAYYDIKKIKFLY